LTERLKGQAFRELGSVVKSCVTTVRIDHYKIRKKIWQPLEDERGRLYPEIEAFLARVPRRGVSIVLLEPERGHKNAETGKRTPRLYSLEHARHLVQVAKVKAELPSM
jgi:hypothetical protein